MVFKFNPSFQTDSESVDAFVVREGELLGIVDALEAAGATGPAPHFLVTGPRGAGKTTLCRRVVAETRLRPELAAAWQSVFLGEESYAVTTPGEFFLECLFHLKDQADGGCDLKNAYEVAAATPDESTLLEAAVGALRAFSAQSGKRLLIVVENFHVIINEQIRSQGASGSSDLLSYLDQGSLFGVLATAVVQGVEREHVPLPAHYTRLELRPLSLAECRRLWQSLTKIKVREERLRPLQILTGGSPRLLHILAEFMRTPSLQGLMSNLNYLIDQNTEYFKSQLDALPAMERKVFATLLDIWDPTTAKEVAEQARIGTNVSSAMLARLTDRGMVVQEKGTGRALIYYAAERLFNIYYLMRRRSHPSSRVRALVSFMVAYYDGDELVDTTAMLVREACAIDPASRSDYHWTFDAILTHSSEDVRAEILRRTPLEFIQPFRDAQRASRDAGTSSSTFHPAGSTRQEIEELIASIEAAADARDINAAYDLIKSGIDSHPGVAELWIRLAFLEHERENAEAAVEAARRAVHLEPEDAWAHAVLGMALSDAGRLVDAESAYLASLQREPGNELALTSLASSYQRADRTGDALKLFEAVRRKDALNDATREAYGKLLTRAERFEEAEEVFREEVDIYDNVSSRRALVEFLEARGRQEEGISILREVAQTTGRWEAHADLGGYLLARTNDYSAARDAFEAAIDLGGDRPTLYSNLADAMIDAGHSEEQVVAVANKLLDRFNDQARAWVLAGLIYERVGNPSEAEAAYRSSLGRDGELGLVPLARLVQARESGTDEAEALLRRAVVSSKGTYRCGPSKELAELLIHKGEEKQAESILRDALRSNEGCSCCLVLQGDVCRRRGDDSTAEQHYRAALALDDGDVAALTGLARLVSVEEANDLASRAIDAAPSDPRALLARAMLAVQTEDEQLTDALDALQQNERFLEARLFVASTLAKRRDLQGALDQLQRALLLLPSQRELTSLFVSTAMMVARLGGAEALLNLIRQNAQHMELEPLAVAIELHLGAQPLVAKEVLLVATDILERSQGGHLADPRT